MFHRGGLYNQVGQVLGWEAHGARDEKDPNIQGMCSITEQYGSPQSPISSLTYRNSYLFSIL